MVGASVALTNVNVELDGNVAEGVMTYSNNGRQTLQATLAAGALDFTPYISTFRLLASGAHDWNRQLFDLNSLSTTDLDMRLSAARVTVGSTRLGRTALGANLRGGALALSVGEAQMYGGIARGSFGVARADAVADVKAQFQFTDVDLQACAGELFGINKLSGRGNLNVSLEASGSSPFGLAQSLDGTANLTGHDGAIAGFNVEQLLKRLERRPLSGAGNFRSGSTPYDNLTVALKFSDGIATVEDIRMDGPAARLTLTGTASVPAREYDLKGVASLVSAPNGAPGFELPFVVQGPWDDPLIFPDPESLIRRSPASQPLLDAVKDRKTRDAVRSVLERFSGGGQKPASGRRARAGERAGRRPERRSRTDVFPCGWRTCKDSDTPLAKTCLAGFQLQRLDQATAMRYCFLQLAKKTRQIRENNVKSKGIRALSCAVAAALGCSMPRRRRWRRKTITVWWGKGFYKSEDDALQRQRSRNSRPRPASRSSCRNTPSRT